jgi:hypothetical protein
MKTAALCIALTLFFIIIVGALRAIVERRFPFLRGLHDDTRHAYMVLTVAAVGLCAWALLDLQIESVDVAGVKATVGVLRKRVDTLSEQIEVFFKSKRIETFDQKNWYRVERVSAPNKPVILQVTLEQEPIPNSVEVFEGVLPMPEQDYHIEGRAVRFSRQLREADERVNDQVLPPGQGSPARSAAIDSRSSRAKAQDRPQFTSGCVYQIRLEICITEAAIS